VTNVIGSDEGHMTRGLRPMSLWPVGLVIMRRRGRATHHEATILLLTRHHSLAHTHHEALYLVLSHLWHPRAYTSLYGLSPSSWYGSLGRPGAARSLIPPISAPAGVSRKQIPSISKRYGSKEETATPPDYAHSCSNRFGGGDGTGDRSGATFGGWSLQQECRQRSPRATYRPDRSWHGAPASTPPGDEARNEGQAIECHA
jgi:hypothetical protein